jgi:hypothetical protein
MCGHHFWVMGIMEQGDISGIDVGEICDGI